MSRKTNDFLDKKMQVKLPENLSKDNILNSIDNSKAEVIEIHKKKNMAKKLVPMVASLLMVVGLVGMYFGMGLGDKKAPVQNAGDVTDVMSYQSYDKIYEKFDAIHKEYEKKEFWDVFLYADEEIMEGDAVADDAVAGNTGAPESSPGNMNNGSTITETTTNKDFGTTNTQEKDVDEGDIIKTDGNYLYIANADDKSISIVDVTGEKMVEASQIDLKDNESVREIYINGNKLVVVGHLQTEHRTENNENYKVYDSLAYVEWDTVVKVYDISDRNAPKLINEYSQQGGYNNSRMIGTKLYAISIYRVNVYNDDYREECIPEVTVNGDCKQIPVDCISIIEESESPTYAVITTLDISKKVEPESSAILGECRDLYASSKGLFLCENVYTKKAEETTKIYRFEYTDTGVEYKCAGVVDGYLNNQFSMSYDGKYFRVATTANKTKVDGDMVSMSVDDRVNNLYILNNDMQIVGKVEDMAKGELIKSVRFVGNMAYVVTFRQTDPLFVIDLSNPEKPTVKGELKIPGFSEYLHPITTNLLVGVGRDGTMTGTNGDCKVSLFDVSNPYEPKESSVLKVSNGAYCHTTVGYNHKVYITLSENEFAVPFSIDYYVNNGEINPSGDYYIRYKLTEDGLCEVARLRVGNNNSWIMGATYVENTFYVVNNCYENRTYVKAYDLATNKEIDSLQTAGQKTEVAVK
ncbi:MAG: beta-propeller domain-containing protein [Clostridia bacterium]|nr:beta-propeller domain-containing protein [Clostridia bacterium]